MAAEAEALLRLVAERPLLFFLLVVLMSWLLEDATALAVGGLARAMAIDPVLALAALLAGTVSGDLLLHGAGRLSRRHRAVLRLVPLDGRLAALGRSPLLVAAARFVPGLRLPAYVGSGVAAMNPWLFTFLVTATALLWVPLIFRLGGAAGQSLPLLFLCVLLVALAPRLLGAPLRRLALRLAAGRAP